MSALLSRPGLHGQRLLGPVQRLNLGLLVHTNTIAFCGGARYNPMMSVSLATSSGSVENLNVSARHGLTPNERHAFNTVAWSSSWS